MPSTSDPVLHYDALKCELKVGFRPTGDYVYLGVPPDEIAALDAASSKSTHINSRIKPRYRFRRI